MIWCIITFSSCVSIGTALMECTPIINDTILTNQSARVSDYDTIFIHAHEFFESNHGDKGRYKSRCDSTDTIGYYMVYEICLWAGKRIDFSLQTITATDCDSNNIPVCAYYRVPWKSVDEDASIPIEYFPFDMYTGISFNRSKIEKHGYIAKMYVEICKPRHQINKMQISFCIESGDKLICYDSKYERKWYAEFRPKLF